LCYAGILRFPSRALGVMASLLILLGGQGVRPVSAEWRPASEVELSRPRGVFVDREGTVLVASPGNDSIVVFKTLSALGLKEEEWPFSLVPVGVIKGIGGPRLESPCDVAVDSGGRVVVADTGNRLVKIYHTPISDPRSRTQIIGRGLTRQFSSPEGVAIDERDNIIVFDTGNRKVQILSPEGKLRAVIPPAKAKVSLAPVAGCYLGKGYLAIAERGAPTFSLWRYNPLSPTSQTCRFIGYGAPAEGSFNFTVRDIAYDRERGTIAYIGSDFPLRSAAFLYIREVAPDDPSKLVAPGDDASFWLRVPLVGWLKDPEGLAFGPGGDLYITDAASDSVQKISRQSFAVLNTPVSVSAQATRATMRYFSPALTPTLFQYDIMPRSVGPSAPSALPMYYEDPADLRDHTVRLADLLSSTRYAYSYLLSGDFFCRVRGRPVRNFSKLMCFATRPRPRTTEYLDFPLTVLLFTNGVFSERQIESLRLQLKATRLFFWVNSRMTCNITPTLIPISDRRQTPLKPPAAGTPGVKAFLSDLENLWHSVSEQVGGELPLPRNLFIIYAVSSHSPKSPRRAVTYGSADMGAAVSVLTQSGDDTFYWSFITECRRQLSISHLASGREDSLRGLLKDPDLDESTVLWDSPADLLRAMGRQSWLSNRYGVFKLTGDADEDGVPDDEPNCPLDEKRFGTNPRAKDTDGDRVSDLNEILASRWASDFPVLRFRKDGTLERTRAMRNRPTSSPSAADSDADGVNDSDDKNPLCPLNDWIPKLNIKFDGTIAAGEWDNASSMRIVDSEFVGVLRVAWNNTYLCFSLTSEAYKTPPSIRIRVDGSADGFLRGSDNLCVVFEEPSEGSFTVRPEADAFGLAMGGASASTSPPPQLIARWSTAGGKLQVEIGVPKSPELGLNLFAGEEIAFDFELRPAKSSRPLPEAESAIRNPQSAMDSLWLRVFEPLTLFRGKLVQPPEQIEMPD